MKRKGDMDLTESGPPERFAAILENQRAIMVNQSTILHNQNKILRGLEQIFTVLPSSQNALSNQPTQSTPPPVQMPTSVQNVSMIHVPPPEPPRVEQPVLTQITVVPAQNMSLQSPHTRVEQQPTVTCTVTPVPSIQSHGCLPSPPLVTVHPVPVPIPITSINTASSPDTSDDEQSPQFASRADVMQIKCKSCSIGNFSVQLLRHIFQLDELANRNCSGTRGKEQVDPVRLKFVKETVFELYGIPFEEKLTTWRHCIRAMDEFLRRPKKQERKFKDVGPPTLVGMGINSKLDVNF